MARLSRTLRAAYPWLAGALLGAIGCSLLWLANLDRLELRVAHCAIDWSATSAGAQAAILLLALAVAAYQLFSFNRTERAKHTLAFVSEFAEKPLEAIKRLTFGYRSELEADVANYEMTTRLENIGSAVALQPDQVARVNRFIDDCGYVANFLEKLASADRAGILDRELLFTISDTTIVKAFVSVRSILKHRAPIEGMSYYVILAFAERAQAHYARRRDVVHGWFAEAPLDRELPA
jgi:hypothetical protein